MKIYTNTQHEICAVESTDRTDLTEHEIDKETLGDWCDTCLCGYKYEPAYEYETDENGNSKMDESGAYVCKLDADGNEKLIGWSFYPFVDINVLSRIQQEHENRQLSQKKAELEADLAIAELSLAIGDILQNE